MTTTMRRSTQPTAGTKVTPEMPTVKITRRKIDSILISIGVVAAAAFAVASGLLTWGHNFSSDYVRKELTSQHVSFPSAASLTAEGRTDLAQWAGRPVVTGDGAQAYASYINGHLAKVADGKTYADLGSPWFAATAAVANATKAGEPQATVAALQVKADAIAAQRTTLFTGETLRGLLLSAYAWSTVGRIAGLAAIGAFAAAAATAVLIALGVGHQRRVPKMG